MLNNKNTNNCEAAESSLCASEVEANELTDQVCLFIRFLLII